MKRQLVVIVNGGRAASVGIQVQMSATYDTSVRIDIETFHDGATLLHPWINAGFLPFVKIPVEESLCSLRNSSHFL